MQGLGLEQVVAISDSNSQQVGPFFKEDPSHVYPKYEVHGGVLYAHGQLRDESWAHVALSKGKVPIGDVAFGGSTENPCEDFDDIGGTSHKRVPEGEKVALKDAEGRKYTGRAHKTIRRDHDTPLENRGVVYHVTDEDSDEGYWLNEKLCGGQRHGMAPSSKLVAAGDDVYLVQSDKDGYVIRIPDIDTGDLLFVDEWKDGVPKLKACTGVEFVQIGRKLYALKSFHDAKGEKRDEQWLRTKDGKIVYEGLSTRVGKWFEFKKRSTGEHIHGVRTYEKNSDGSEREIVVNEKGTMHYIKEGDNLKAEANDSPAGDGVHEIDGEVLLKIFLYKEDPNPTLENDDTEVVYRREDQTDAFGGPHDEEMPNIEGRANTIVINGRTGKLFKDRSTGEIYWMGSDGRGMFGRGHWNDLKTIEWKYGSDGARLGEGQATILKHVEDVARGHTLIDYQANAYCQNSDRNEQGYHKNVRDIWVLSYEGKNMLVAETEDSVSAGRRIGNFLSKVFSRDIIHPSKWLERPSTYCAIDGTTGSSIAELAQKLGAPSDYKLVKVDDFEDAIVTTSRRRDSQIWKSPAASARGAQDVLAEIAAAEAAAGVKRADDVAAGAPDSQDAADTAVNGTPGKLPGDFGAAAAEKVAGFFDEDASSDGDSGSQDPSSPEEGASSDTEEQA
jgi:hypothetical protein